MAKAPSQPQQQSGSTPTPQPQQQGQTTPPTQQQGQTIYRDWASI